jgi:hypothetical protein
VARLLNEAGYRYLYEFAGMTFLPKHIWKDVKECLDDILKPAGITYDDFKRMGMLKGKWEYKGYEKKF